MSGRSRAASIISLVVFVACAANASADVITTIDGARLVGSVQKITPEAIEFKTSYAGVLTVAMDQVTNLATDAPLTSRLSDQTTVTGVTTLDADESAAGKSIHIADPTAPTSAPVGQLMASWLPDATPPPESGVRHWIYTAAVDISGKRGNTDESTKHFIGSASLVSKRDELKLYTSYENDQTDNDETADESIVGATYSVYGEDPWGWYVRGELERDPFEDIDLRATGAGGLSWRPINTKTRTLKFFTGVGYRHEEFKSGIEDNNTTTLDTGLSHRWVLEPWLTMLNELTYAPSIDDFGNYLLSHDSSLELPVGTGRRWLLRIGVRNDYNSDPAPGKDDLDTFYYTRMLLKIE